MNLSQIFIILILRHRLPKEQWWLKLRPLNRILAKHETVYISESILDFDDVCVIDSRVQKTQESQEAK